jgi:hypothetical protein
MAHLRGGNTMINGDIVIGVVAVAGIAAAYFDRKALKADVLAVKAAASADAQKFLNVLRGKELTVRARVSIDVAKVIADTKVWADTAKADAQSVIAKIEAEIKKVI